MSLATIACASLVSAAMAQQGAQRPAAPNIAVVNLTAVFDRYSMIRDLEDLFSERRDIITAEAENRRDNINFKRNELKQFKPGTPDFREREESLVRAEISFQVWLEVQERRVKDEHKAWLETIYQSVRDCVARIASQRGIDLVLTYKDLDPDAPDSVALKREILLRTVLYASKRADLTERVLDELDADYRKRGGAASLQLNRGAGPPTTPAPTPQNE